ncbi:hypothetical protein PoB_004604800 [Plakobranchus ocellatus]|uniref:Uncharacterized protein n=1 Tax=Plakobranchus ocellatus TaxID=259542 RepID=A0AAV4BL55_9GAST|nr:hypothetical protein PoB_004604800 [Plakobranchus ocellatus]
MFTKTSEMLKGGLENRKVLDDIAEVSSNIADKSVPLRKEFLSHSGDTVLPYKLWICLFDNYIYMRDAARNQPSSDEDKNRLLINLLGLEGIRIYSAQPMLDRISTASHEEFRSPVRSVFQVPVNPFRVYDDLK